MNKVNSRYESIYEEYKLYNMVDDDEILSWVPSGSFAIIVTRTNGSVYRFNSLSHGTRCIRRDRYDYELDMSRDEYKKQFSILLKERMKDELITQKDLSERTGLTQKTISKYINGEQIPDVYNIYKLAKALNCDPSDFYGYGY